MLRRNELPSTWLLRENYKKHRLRFRQFKGAGARVYVHVRMCERMRL